MCLPREHSPRIGTFNIFVVFVMFVFICFLHKSFFVYFRITYLYQTQIIIFIIIRFVFFFNLLLNFTPAHSLQAVAWMLWNAVCCGCEYFCLSITELGLANILHYIYVFDIHSIFRLFHSSHWCFVHESTLFIINLFFS